MCFILPLKYSRSYTTPSGGREGSHFNCGVFGGQIQSIGVWPDQRRINFDAHCGPKRASWHCYGSVQKGAKVQTLVVRFFICIYFKILGSSTADAESKRSPRHPHSCHEGSRGGHQLVIGQGRKRGCCHQCNWRFLRFLNSHFKSMVFRTITQPCIWPLKQANRL